MTEQTAARFAFGIMDHVMVVLVGVFSDVHQQFDAMKVLQPDKTYTVDEIKEVINKVRKREFERHDSQREVYRKRWHEG